MFILLVDDDTDDQTLFCEALHLVDPHIYCEIANHGVEALASLNSSSSLPDLIFLDINMPVMDGRDCLREIKSSQRLQSIPVIIYSTSNNKTEIHALQQIGAGFRTKPTRFDLLVSMLDECIGSVQQKIKAARTIEPIAS